MEQQPTRGVTFTVSEGLKATNAKRFKTKTMAEMMKTNKVMKKKERVLLQTTEEANTETSLGNGFVGTAFQAYSKHCHLVISPDSVWIAIITALASYIDRHPEEMRDIFVSHQGKKELVVYGKGNIKSANYAGLIEQLVELIGKETKDNYKDWLECSFTTTTPLTKTVSKIVVMGAMKNYFNYKICLECGLPMVTLEGTVDDWKEIRTRAARLGQMKSKELSDWAIILGGEGGVLDHFVDAFEGKIDKHWWNSIALCEGEGSGSPDLTGWILAFCPWDDDGTFILQNPKENKGSYGEINSNDIPASTVEVPVTIDDNGTTYKTLFYAGNIHTKMEKSEPYLKLSSVQDWALIDITYSS